MKNDSLKGQHRINEQIRAKEVRIVGERVAEVAADGAVDGGGARIVFGHRFLYELELLRQRGPGGEVETGLARDAAHRLLRQIERADAGVAGPFIDRSSGFTIVDRSERKLVQVIGQRPLRGHETDRLAGPHGQPEQGISADADRARQGGHLAVIQHDERHTRKLLRNLEKNRPHPRFELFLGDAAEQRRDARLVVDIDARRAAADRIDARQSGRRPLQRIDDPFDVIIDVALKIRVPDDLLAVDGFAVDDRRAFAVRASEVETDPAAVEMAAEPEPDLLRFRRGFIRAADDGERMIVDFFASGTSSGAPATVSFHPPRAQSRNLTIRST